MADTNVQPPRDKAGGGAGRESERRRQILAAAGTVFARQGYHGARMDDVVAESGLSKGTLYWYFKSKEELATALVHQILDAEHAGLSAAGDPERPAAERLEELARGFARGLTADADRALLTLELLTLAQRVPQIKVCFTAHHARFAEQLRALLLEIAGDGEDAERRAGSAATGLAALVDGLVLHWTLSDTDFDLEARLVDAVSALVRGLH